MRDFQGPQSVSTDSLTDSPVDHGNRSRMDDFFPLWAHIFETTHINYFLLYPFIFVYFIQMLFVTSWPWAKFWDKDESREIIRILRTYMFFYPQPAKDYYYFILTMIFFSFSLISAILIYIQISYYKVQRKFITFLCYPIRLYLETLSITFMTPNLVCFGETFLLIAYGNRSAFVIISLLLSIFNELYMTFTFIIVNYLASTSIFLHNSPLGTFDVMFFKHFAIGLHSISMLYFVFYIFENWSSLFIIFLNICVFVYTIGIIGTYLYLEDLLAMAAAIGFGIACITGDIFAFIAYFYPKLPFYYPLAGIAVSFVIFAVIAFIYVVFRTKIIINKLSVEKSSLQEYYDYYDSIGLDKNESRALMYMRIGLQYNCRCFTNLSLLQYISEKYETEKAIHLCLYFSIFFPKEVRLQSKLELQLTDFRQLGFVSRFLLYQLHIIKMIRQFTDNNIVKMKILEMRNISQQCEEMTKFGLEGKFDKGYFEGLANFCLHTRALWKEALVNYPNNPKICEQYCRYLIEAESDFVEAIKMKHRQHEIELGKSFTVDNCFRFFVKRFPRYLTQKIVNLDGKILTQIQSQQQPANATQTEADSRSDRAKDESSTLEVEQEDFIGKLTIKQSRERLALHRLLDNKIPKPIKFIKTSLLIIVAYLILVYIISTFYAYFKVDHHFKLMDILKYLSFARFYSALSNMCMMCGYFLSQNGLQKYKPFFENFLNTTKNARPFIELEKYPPAHLMNFTNITASYYTTLMDFLSDEAMNGINVYTFLHSFLDLYLPYKSFAGTCDIITESKSSLASIYSMFYTTQRLTAGYTDYSTINRNNDVCGIAQNFIPMYLGSQHLYEDIGDFQINDALQIKHSFKRMSIIVPIITFLVCSIPMLVLHFYILKIEHDLKEIIITIDQQSRNEAMEPLRVNCTEDGFGLNDFGKMKSHRLLLILIHMAFAFFFFFIMLAINLLVMQCTNNMVKLNQWSHYSSIRLALVAEATNAVLNLIMMIEIPDMYRPQYRTKYLNLSLALMLKLKQADDNLVLGTNDSAPCQGFDRELDQLNIIQERFVEEPDQPNEYYQFASIRQMIQIYYNYVFELYDDIRRETNYTNSTAANALFISNYLLFDKCYRASERLIELSNIQSSQLGESFIFCGVALLLGIICLFIHESRYYSNRTSSYKAALYVIKRINPYALLNNKKFSKMFLKEKESVADEKPSIEGSIIKNANDSIICTNIHGVVEVANQTTTSLLGYTPDQILGQSISLFFINENIDKIHAKMDQMRNNQSSLYYEDDYYVISDDSRTIPVHCIIIGMRASNDVLQSFVFILKDNTRLYLQKQQAESEKARSETLLYQILPRDIVLQINKGEKDISFNVPSASVIFIDINKFSSYSANLTPNEIMSNLSFYFSVIDDIAAQYETLTKIKLIGDIYMASSGLFNQDIPAETHAEQAILFSLDVIDALENINKSLSSNLQVRVGINTGGPLIAGVLGTDKPCFDIIGDIINVAARLQSTSDVNKVHISNDTYKIVSQLSYNFVECGMTFLKGKGNQLTYYVSRPTV